jgi:hypothetical protein
MASTPLLAMRGTQQKLPEKKLRNEQIFVRVTIVIAYAINRLVRQSLLVKQAFNVH